MKDYKQKACLRLGLIGFGTKSFMSITYCLSICPLPDFSNVVLLWGKFVFVFPDNDMVVVKLFFGCYASLFSIY